MPMCQMTWPGKSLKKSTVSQSCSVATQAVAETAHKASPNQRRIEAPAMTLGSIYSPRMSTELPTPPDGPRAVPSPPRADDEFALSASRPVRARSCESQVGSARMDMNISGTATADRVGVLALEEAESAEGTRRPKHHEPRKANEKDPDEGGEDSPREDAPVEVWHDAPRGRSTRGAATAGTSSP